MEELDRELARVTAERRRLQRQAQKMRWRKKGQQEHAILAATIAFCHEPNAVSMIAEATLRKWAASMEGDVASCVRVIQDRFLATPVQTLFQWLEGSEDIPRVVHEEARRLVEDARVLHWVEEQCSAQGVAPPPQFVWETRCALDISCNVGEERRAAAWRPARSAAAKKWMQRFRHRWSLSLGHLPAKDCLPAATMQTKARNGVPEFVHTRSGLGPKMGAVFWPHFVTVSSRAAPK